MSPSQVIDSFKRCQAKPGFLDRFYQLFLASSPRVAERFRNTDFERQKVMLRASLHTLLAGASDGGAVPGAGPIRAHLEHMAQRHGRLELDIPPDLYDLWLHCLVQAVSEHDPEFSDEVGNAWRQALRPGIDFMRAHY
jgi:hemoglobin-like flavoprotein